MTAEKGERSRLEEWTMIYANKSSHLDGKVELFALKNPAKNLLISFDHERSRRDLGECSLCIVDIEEIRIENGLDNAGNNGNGIKVAVFSEEAVDPIEDVKRTIDAQCKEVMGSDGLSFSRSLKHE